MRRANLVCFFMVLGASLVFVVPDANARRNDYQSALKEVQKQENDLRKAQASLHYELRKRDHRGIRKAQEWVRKEQQDLWEAKANLRAVSQYSPRYRTHHSYQNLPRIRDRRYGNGEWKRDHRYGPPRNPHYGNGQYGNGQYRNGHCRNGYYGNGHY